MTLNDSIDALDDSFDEAGKPVKSTASSSKQNVLGKLIQAKSQAIFTEGQKAEIE